MPSKADLVCVDPARVAEIWPFARPFILRAFFRTTASEAEGTGAFEEVERGILGGDQLLWLAWSGKIEAAATTRLIKGGVCIVTACSGAKRERWLPLFAQIEAYARAEGCSVVRISGRKGWQRVLLDYQPKYVILEKGL
jgi:hypothetical protein